VSTPSVEFAEFILDVEEFKKRILSHMQSIGGRRAVELADDYARRILSDLHGSFTIDVLAFLAYLNMYVFTVLAVNCIRSNNDFDGCMDYIFRAIASVHGIISDNILENVSVNLKRNESREVRGVGE